MTFLLAETLSAPVAFTITPLINAFSETNAKSIHHTIQQLRGGDAASDDIISSFKDELRRMRQDLGREAKLELKATRAELRQKLGMNFDHEDDTRGEITEDDEEVEDEYEYVEEEVEIEVEVDDDDDLEIEEEIDDDDEMDVVEEEIDDDDEMDVVEGETNDESYAMEDDDLDNEEAAEEEDLDYDYIDKNRQGEMDKKEDFDEEDLTEDLSEEIQDQTKQEIIDNDIFEVHEDGNIPDVHEESQEIEGTIEEDAIEIGESEEIDGNEEMVDTMDESPQVKPKKEKVKKKKKSTKSNQKKKSKSKKSSSVDTEKESAMVANRMAKELALKTTRQSESSLGNIVRALIPSILVLLLIALSHFGFELLLKRINPNESS